MYDKIKINSLRKKVAEMTDKLLSFEEDLSKLIAMYDTADISAFRMQCSVHQAKCVKLIEKTESLQSSLEEIQKEMPFEDSKYNSLFITMQLLMQDKSVLQQNLQLLENLLSDSEAARDRMKAAHNMDQARKLMELKNVLWKERNGCD